MSGRPSKELLDALENLEAFLGSSTISLSSSMACLQVVDGKIRSVQQNALKNIVCFFKAFIVMLFCEFPLFLKRDVYEIIVQSCAIIKKNAVLLYLWEDGSLEQRRFAVYAKAIVERFNRTVEEINGVRRLFSFFQNSVDERLSKIDLVPLAFLNKAMPSVSSTQYNPLKMFTKQQQKTASPHSDKVSRLRESFLPLQAHELFIMKAISLLEKRGIASHEEARLMTRGNTINTIFDAESGIHTLTLTLHPSLGRVIEIQGSFMGRIPLADSFQITVGFKAAI